MKSGFDDWEYTYANEINIISKYVPSTRRKLRKNPKINNDLFECKKCKCTIKLDSLKAHLKTTLHTGKKIKKKIKKSTEIWGTKLIYCKICDCFIQERILVQHQKTNKHNKNIGKTKK
jgi:thioredoxin reductase